VGSAEPNRDADVAAIEKALIILVRRSNHPRRHLEIVRRAGVDIDRSTYVVLGRISDAQRLRVSELAAELGIDISTASRQVARAESQGLVRRAVDANDARAAVLELTAEGRRILTKVRRVRRSWLESTLDTFTPRQRRDLADLLTRLATALDADSPLEVA
jgi:DNA-binding MarR family transcriptional regulator